MGSNRGVWIAGIGGGIAGSIVTAVVLFAAAPELLGPRVVRAGLTSQPEILIEAGEALRERQYSEALEPIRAALETPFHSSWKGAARPDVTLTYFYDYACGYCRASNPHLERLLTEDKGLRIVYREFPILGADSVGAARVSLAASKAGKFRQFHDALYEAGRPTVATVAAAGEAAGIKPAQARSPDIEAELQRNFQLAGQLGATGTPLFVIGDRVINSAVEYEVLKEAVAAARDS